MKIIVLIAYAFFIGFMSLRQIEGPSIEHVDKVFHFGAYGLFAILGFIASKDTKTFFFVCLAIILYGGLLEWAQFYVVERDMSVFDFAANTVGVLVGALIAHLVRNRLRPKAPSE